MPGDSTRRVAALLVSVLVLQFALAACGGSASSGADDDITWMVWGDPEEVAVYESMVADYEAAHTGAAVKLDVVPSQGDFMTKLSASLTGGSAPDVFLINYRRYAQFADAGTLEPLAERATDSDVIDLDTFYDVPLEAFTWNGELQCLPFNMSSLVVYYNRTLFEQQGVPLPTDQWTWDDFLAAAQALTLDTDGDGTTDTYGVDFEPTIIRAAPFIWSNGGALQSDPDDPRSLTLDTSETRGALQFFIDLSLVHHVVPDKATYAASDPESRFMDGSAAMTLNSRRSTPVFRSIVDFDWDVAPIPVRERRVSTLHSDAFCIAQDSEHKDAAWRFIEYALSDTGQETAAALGRTVPSSRTVAESPVFLDPTRKPANSQLFLDLGPELEVLPILPEWPEIEKTINEELYVAFFGNKPLDDALATAQSKIDEILSR